MRSWSRPVGGDWWHASQVGLARVWCADPDLELPDQTWPGPDPAARARSRSQADRRIASTQCPPEGSMPELRGRASHFLVALIEVRSELLAARRLPGLGRNLLADHRHRARSGGPETVASQLFLHASGHDATSGDAHLDAQIQATAATLHPWDSFLGSAVALAEALAPTLADARQADAGPPPDPQPHRTTPDRRPAPSSHPGRAATAPMTDPAAQRSQARYAVYDRRDDEVTTPARLLPAPRLQELRRTLDAAMAEIPARDRIGWRRLHHRLAVRGSSAWSFDELDGVIDPARIAQIVARPSTPLAFKRERDAATTATTLSLLVDCSRSMAGPNIRRAAACADALASTLERCGVAVELLGYTTRDWSGGRAVRRWEAAGRPSNPGRLNAVRHVVYKPAETPVALARRGFGALLEPSLLKENIDGEALLWAHRRLAQRTGRRCLVVLSDGAPDCEATRKANGASYLTRHLRDVVEAIKARGQVELFAIGLHRRVGRLYPHHVQLDSMAELGAALQAVVARLFGLRPSGSPPAGGRRRT